MFEIYDMFRAIVLNACEEEDDLENYLNFHYREKIMDFNNLNIFVSTDFDFDNKKSSRLKVQYVDELTNGVPEYAQKSVEISRKNGSVEFTFRLGTFGTARIIIEDAGRIELTTFDGRYFSFQLLDDKLVWRDLASFESEYFENLEYSTDIIVNKILSELTKSCIDKNIPMNSSNELFEIVKPAIVLGILDFNKIWMNSVNDKNMYDDIMNIIDDEYLGSKVI